MELIAGGRLSHLIKQKCESGKRFSDLEASKLIKGILSGVVYIHDKGIMHRDLKPENILLADKDDLSSVKIIDFGLS